MNITVYAASGDMPAEIYHAAASELGKLMAEGGHTLVYGGGNGGLMGDCARAALENGGKVIGIAPSFFIRHGVTLGSCTEFIATDTMSERKTLLEEKADAFIVLPGGTGTMDEFFETLTNKQLGLHGKPIAVLNTDGYYSHILSFINDAIGKKFISARCAELYSFCSTPADAVEYVMNAPVFKGDLNKLHNYGK